LTSTINPLQPFLENSGLLMLDGGLATELENRGHDLDDALWSARLLVDDPMAIAQVHQDYLAAGADCLITASYQGTIHGFKQRGFGKSEAEGLLTQAVQLALDARDAFWAIPENRPGRIRPIVAASIGPYGAALADGSEYTGNYDLEEEGLRLFHRRRFQILADTRADIMACETIPSYLEATALISLLQKTPDRYAWFAFSCRDDKRINDGTPLAICAELLDGIDQVAAVGINCTAPGLIPGLIAEIKRVSNKPIIVYPNSGEEYDSTSRRWVGSSDSDGFAQASLQWRSAGATLIGGCCRTGPEHIRKMRSQLIK
jgi:homocysteine S-methyltransferase